MDLFDQIFLKGGYKIKDNTSIYFAYYLGLSKQDKTFRSCLRIIDAVPSLLLSAVLGSKSIAGTSSMNLSLQKRSNVRISLQKYISCFSKVSVTFDVSIINI